MSEKEELSKVIQSLNETEAEMDKISKQWAVLKHEYRSTKDSKTRSEIKEKWNKLQEDMEVLEKKRRQILEKKNDLDYKNRWKVWK